MFRRDEQGHGDVGGDVEDSVSVEKLEDFQEDDVGHVLELHTLVASLPKAFPHTPVEHRPEVFRPRRQVHPRGVPARTDA